MHMADALLSPAVATTMYATSAVAAGLSIQQLKKENNKEIVPVMAVTSALVFAGQMINYTIPGTGSSGHICGGMLLSALLGPQAGFLSMITVLLIQCLFFADGGLMALGANIWNMAFYGCFVGYYLIWRPIMRSKLFSNTRIKIIVASILGSIISLQLGAFSVVLETSLSGITELPFIPFAGIMLPIHLAIGLIEGCITAAILLFVYSARGELIKDVDQETKGHFSLKQTIATLAVVTLFIGGGLSLYASSNPDGLEWALFGNAEEGYQENMGLNEEEYGLASDFSIHAEQLQESTSFLPDYSFKDNDSALGTTVSGIVGAVIVAIFTFLLTNITGIFRNKKEARQ